MGEVLMESLKQPVFVIQLENIERENFDGLLATHQFHQYPPCQNCALHGKPALAFIYCMDIYGHNNCIICAPVCENPT